MDKVILVSKIRAETRLLAEKAISTPSGPEQTRYRKAAAEWAAILAAL